MSPLEMVCSVLVADRKRHVVVTPHPKEKYGDAELTAINELAQSEDRLTVSRAKGENLTKTCDYVATQNSSSVLAGYFYSKPAVLFAKIDFHHIAANVEHVGVQAAIDAMDGELPEFARYLYWFLQLQAINAGRPDAEAQILAAVRRHGWDI